MNVLRRIRNSFNARIIQPYITTHFQQTTYGKKFASLQGVHNGKRCFIIGNGPSLRVEDLDVLTKHNEITFAFNRIYIIFDQTDWRPTYYISQDEKTLQACTDIVSKLTLKNKFIPIQLKWYYGCNISDSTYFNLKNQKLDLSMGLKFSDDISKEIFNASTCVYTAAQIAAYMGFKEIYLLGIDHHFHTSINNSGQIVIDPTAKDYFSDKYNEDKQNLYIPNTEKSTLTYISMKSHCNKRGIKVFNATRGGKLEIFPRINIETLLNF